MAAKNTVVKIVWLNSVKTPITAAVSIYQVPLVRLSYGGLQAAKAIYLLSLHLCS